MDIKQVNKPNCITILGPTASGKTSLAVNLAHQLEGEILSIDSRQIYRELNIGTGKDLSSYIINGNEIPHHLINISEPGIKRNLLFFFQAFNFTFEDVIKRNKIPVLCGGTGLYLETVLNQKKLLEVPDNESLRLKLLQLNKQELLNELELVKPFLETFQIDASSSKRIIRAIEIGEFQKTNGQPIPSIEKIAIQSVIFGLNPPIEKRRAQIAIRLRSRIDEGLIDEVEHLLAKYGSEFLFWCGLEYKFISKYLTHKISLETCITQLETAINQYAKRQMTWFRKMERSGFQIHWLDTNQSSEEQALEAIKIYKRIMA